MRDMDEYVEEVRKKTGYPVSKDDPVFIIHDFFQFFESDFRDLSQQTMESWLVQLDKRRNEFNEAISLRTDHVVRDALRLARASVEETFRESTKTFFEDIRFQLDQEKIKLEQDRKTMRLTCLALVCLVVADMLL